MIDIVIPVYNALNMLKDCISSIEKYTDFSKARVILINDSSTDPNVSPYLNSLDKDHFFIVDHENNLGFSASVNDGIDFSKTNDVILLNSDTVVTEKWVEKLYDCAYAKEEIGLVVPLSNSGELCSVPYFCFDNPVLPNGLSIDQFSRIIEECSLREYPLLPLAICFCTYIKRAVFNVVGYFDANTFEKGYGEDNDFSTRAQLLGFDTVMCDDLFIFHKGSTSFGKKKRSEEVPKKEKILRNRYPYYSWLRDYYVTSNPFTTIQKTARFWAAYNNGKKNILTVTHRGFEIDSKDYIGGTQFHVMDMKNALKDDYNIVVLSRGDLCVDINIYVSSSRFIFKYKLSNPGPYVEYHNKEIEEIFTKVLSAFKIDIVHFHHIKYLSQRLPLIAKAYNIPYCITLHDYYFISPCLKLMKPDKTECMEIKECNSCLIHNKEVFSEFQPNSLLMVNKWNESSKMILSSASKVFAPSNYVKQKYTSFNMDYNTIVIPHGYGYNSQKRQGKITQYFIDSICKIDEWHIQIQGWAIVRGIPSDELSPSATFYIGDEQITSYGCSICRPDLSTHFESPLYLYSGFMIQVSKNIYELADSFTILLESATKVYSIEERRYTNKKNVQLHHPHKSFNVAFIGGICEAKGSKVIIQMIKQTRSNPHIHWYIMGGCGDPELANLNEKHLTFTGWYDRQDIVALLKTHCIDLVCIPSMFPETFCYTLSEAYSAGIPVVVSKLGALYERVKNDNTGWIISDYKNPNEYIRTILSIINNKSEYNEKKNNIETLPDYSLKTMGMLYKQEYEDAISSLPVKKKKLNENDIQFIRKGFTEERDNEIENLKSTLSEIQNSFTYKVVNKIQTTNFPGKKIAKATMRKIYWKLKK